MTSSDTPPGDTVQLPLSPKTLPKASSTVAWYVPAGTTAAQLVPKLHVAHTAPLSDLILMLALRFDTDGETVAVPFHRGSLGDPIDVVPKAKSTVKVWESTRTS